MTNKPGQEIEINNLSFLKNLTIALSYCKDIDEINQVVGEKVKELIPDAYILVTSTNESRDISRLSKIFGFEKTLETIKKYLNADPFKLRFPIKETRLKELELYSSGKLFELEEGVYNLLNRKYSKPLCKTIEVFLGIKKISAIGFTQNGIIYGTLVLSSHNDIDDSKKAVIESIVTQASIIIQQKFLVRNLKRNEDKYNFLIENIKTAIYIINHEGKFLYVNTYAAEIVDKTKSEMTGQTMFEVYPGVNMESTLKDVQYVIDNKREYEREKEYSFNNKSLWFNTKLQPYYDASTEETVALLISSVITDKKQIEQELLLAKEKVETSDKIKSSFLANLSYEVRSPMNSILGFAQLIKDSQNMEEINEYADVIYSGGMQIMKLFGNILDIAKAEEGIARVEKKEFSLNHLIDSLYKTYLHHPKVKDNSIELKIKKNTKDIILTSDDYKLQQIFVNLLDNAFKFSNSGIIEFGYMINVKNQIEYFVEDHGIGMSQDQKEKIFQSNYSIDTSDTMSYKGIGIGLKLVKAFIDLLHGSLGVETVLGKGSSFYFTIP